MEMPIFPKKEKRVIKWNIVEFLASMECKGMGQSAAQSG